MLTHLDPQDPKNGKATKLHKLQGVCTDDGRVGGRGGQRLCPTERGENCRTAMPRPRGFGPWPDIRAYAPTGGPLEGKGS